MTAEWIQRSMALEPDEAREYLDLAIEAGVSVNSDEGIQLIVQRSAADTKFFAQVFLAESFDCPMSWAHDLYWNLLDDERYPLVGICAWRGFGKTTGLKAKVVKAICFRQQRFLMWTGKSLDYASRETENIKAMLLTNPRLRYVFGNFRAQKYDGLDVTFSKTAWFACDPNTGEPICFVLPRGAGQQVRGSNVYIAGRNQRPTLILVDDLESDEDVLNDETRHRIREWFHGSLLNCIDTAKIPSVPGYMWSRDPIVAAPWRVFYVDTLKHEDANIAHILDDSSWRTVRLPQAEFVEQEDGKKNYRSCVPELFSDEQVRMEAAAADRRGQLDTYCREKLCLPVSPERQCFTRSMFQYYSEGDVRLNRNPNVDRFIIVDPAKTGNVASAYTAILAVAADCANQRIYLRRLINERLAPDVILDKTFSVALATNSQLICVETTGLEMHIQYQFKTAAAQRGLPVSFCWLKAQSTPQGDYGTGRDARKRARAAQIIPFYRKANVWHEHSLRDSALEQQELSYPRPAKWDALDCAGYVPQVLEYIGRYFQPSPEAELEEFMDSDDLEGLTTRIQSREWATV